MDRKIFEKIMIFLMIFKKILEFFQKKNIRGPGQTSPAIWLGQNWRGPMARLIILPLHAEMNSACSGSTKKKEATQGGEPPEVVRVCGRAGDVCSAAQGTSAEVTVAGGRGSREEEEEEEVAEERETLEGEEEEGHGGCLVAG
jgi:hypothetical protein